MIRCVFYCVVGSFFLFTVSVFAQSPINLSASRQLIVSKIDSLNTLAKTIGLSNTDSLKHLAEQALKLSKQVDYQEGFEKASFFLAIYKATIEKYPESLDRLYRYLDYVKTKENLSEQIHVIIKIGYLYLDIENYELSYTYFNDAINLSKKTKDPKDFATSYQNLARYYYKTHQNKLALKNIDMAMNYSLQLDSQLIISQLDKLCADIYIEEGELNLSLNHYIKALSGFKKSGDITEEAIILTRLVHIYQLLNQPHKALTNAKLAFEIRKKQKNRELLSLSLINLGNAFIYVGNQDSALYYYQLGLKQSLISNNKRAIEYAYLQLYKFFKQGNRMKTALYYLEQYLQVHDSVLLDKINSETNAKELRYFEKDKETQIQLLRKENEIQRLTIKNRTYAEFITQLFIGIALIVILILVYLAGRNKLEKNKLEKINSQLDQEVQERENTEIQLRKNEQLYRFVTSHTLDMIVRLDKNLNLLYLSPSAKTMLGAQTDQINELPGILSYIHPDFRDTMLREYRRMIHHKIPIILTHLLVKQDGSSSWAESLVNPIFDRETGLLKETITVVRDISERVSYEEALAESANQKEVLLREIHHRVKNNFAILVSLISMQKESANLPGSVQNLNELQQRIRTMSLVHELLYRSDNLHSIPVDQYILQLLTIISSAFSEKQVEVITRLEPCIANIETALPLGLIINELLTNCYKYAFNHHPSGKLTVELVPLDRGTTSAHLFRLTIQDNGPGLPPGFDIQKANTMGSQIVRLLTEQLEARLEITNQEGARFSFFFDARQT